MAKGKSNSQFFIGMVVMGIIIIGGFYVLNNMNFMPTHDNTPTIPDQQVKISFKIVDASTYNPITSGITAYIYTQENGLYVRQDTLTPDSNGLVTSTGYYEYNDVVYVQLRSGEIGSNTYYTTPIKAFTVTFSDKVDQGSTVFIDTITAKKVTSAGTLHFAKQDGTSVTTGNFSTSDTAIIITLSGLTDNTYFGGDDVVDYYYTPERQYIGGVFIVVKSSAVQNFVDTYATFSDNTYNYYVFKFDQVHDDSSTVALETYQLQLSSGATLNAGSLSISIYDYYYALSGNTNINNIGNFKASYSITGYNGYVV